ncbi:MAG TPA: PLP-dependent aminotransferase family protein, partial [Clostridia bacterium]|nr:PLP-dependent aminotransferase family protein [Clostridia bacterium]
MEKKYQAVIDYIKQEAANKSLKPGSKLPSILAVSKLLQCNKDTVIRAYNELVKEHVVYSVPKSGYYLVSKSGNENGTSEADCIDFSSCIYNSKVIPDIELQHCLNQSIEQYRDKMLTVNDVSGGIVSLRKAIQKQLQDTQVFTAAENIFITTGSQQALSVLVNTPLPNGKNKVLVEQPTCSEILNALELCKAETIGIERNFSGIDLDELESIFKNEDIKFFYTMPRFHNPTGYSYSSKHKEKILKLAQKYNVYVVEDDCFAELDTKRKADPMFCCDNSLVFYMKNYSKLLFPWMRLGMTVFPKQLTDLFNGMKICSDILEQGALELYIKNGMYCKHIARLKEVYRSRMNTLKNACGKHLDSEIKLHIPNTGCHACIELPENIPAHTLAGSLKMRNIKIASADSFYLTPYQKTNCIFLNIHNVDEEKIEQG